MLPLILILCFQTPVDFRFVDVTQETGLVVEHGFSDAAPSEPQKFSGGVAAGDYDNDGFTDLYVVAGHGPNKLFRNKGDGTFEEVAERAGVQLAGLSGSGPTFADYDGDGFLDLLVGGVSGSGPRLMRNMGNGVFEDRTASSGLVLERDTISAAFADYDRDGDLDLFLTHWTMGREPAGGHLWRNKGDGSFESVDREAGITGFEVDDFSFTPNFADINNDEWPDLLVTGDFGTSKIFVNQGGVFQRDLEQVLTDENGMGGAVGDYDNDGDLDWFVSSIWDPNPDSEQQWTGNRLYRNRGNGVFDEVSLSADVRRGYWGWGASFADFNNDGHLDLYQTNGWFGPLAEDFERDPSRFFLSSGKGYFVERSQQLGLGEDRGQGRGVVCLDYDGDGDLDLFVANGFGKSVFYRNDQPQTRSWLAVTLGDNTANTRAIGARIVVNAGEQVQMRELRAGSNYVSQNPVEARFGTPQGVDTLSLRWPDGETAVYHDVALNRTIKLHREALHQYYLPMNPLQLTDEAWLTVIQEGNVPATVVVTAMSAEGIMARRSLPHMPPGGRTRMNLDQIPQPFNWLFLESDQPLLACVEGVNAKGGFAAPATSVLYDQLITPHIAADTERFYTRANFVNGGDQPAQILLTTPDQAVWDLELNRPGSGRLLDFQTFWGGAVSSERTMAVLNASSPGSLAGMEVFGYRNQPGMAGLTLTGQTSKRLIFSHVADAEAGWWTGLVTVNPSDRDAALTVIAYNGDGDVVRQAGASLPAGSKITALVDQKGRGEALMQGGLPPETAWVEVLSDQEISGYELFGTVSGGWFAGLQAGTGFVGEITFPFAGDEEYFAGLALVGRQSGTVTWSLLDDEGRTVATASQPIAAGSRLLTMASDLFSQTGRFLGVKSTGGVHGFLLRGPRNGAWLVGLNGLAHATPEP